MTYPRLSEAIALNSREIERAQIRASAGVFILGMRYAGGAITPRHFGRSDGNLRADLIENVGRESHFVFAHLKSAARAFEAECELFHHLGSQGGSVHPDKPVGLDCRCPRCGR